jgi:hypothetical protein
VKKGLMGLEEFMVEELCFRFVRGTRGGSIALEGVVCQ